MSSPTAALNSGSGPSALKLQFIAHRAAGFSCRARKHGQTIQRFGAVFFSCLVISGRERLLEYIRSSLQQRVNHTAEMRRCVLKSYF